MKQYTVKEVLSLIKPTQNTYNGLPAVDKENISSKYQQAKEVLQRDGVSVLLNMRLNTLVEQTAGMYDGTRKSILINAVIYKGLDGWTNPHNRNTADGITYKTFNCTG